jgi:transketolase
MTTATDSATRADRVEKLEAKARELRYQILTMIHHVQSGHPGGSLSAADIVTALYFDIMRIDPKIPRWPERDRFVLSKGHACPVLYGALALRGYFPVEELLTLRQFESRLQGHPVKDKAPGIEATTGSLGQGISMAVGMAMEGKFLRKEYRVYTLLGDGEIQEGQVYEAAQAARKFGLDNLIAIVDNNQVQNDGFTRDVMPVEDVEARFRAFGWQTKRIDGHDMPTVLAALEEARDFTGKPFCVIADTVKGRGVSFMELDRAWHGKAPNDAEYEKAVREVLGEER